jgi:hypothetical protein
LHVTKSRHASSEAAILGPRSLATPFQVPSQRFNPPACLLTSAKTSPPGIQPASYIFPPHLSLLLIHNIELNSVLARASSIKPFTSPSVDRPMSLSSYDSWSLSVNLRPLTYHLHYTKPSPYCDLWPYHYIWSYQGSFYISITWFISTLRISVPCALFPIFLPYHFNTRFLSQQYKFKLKKREFF